MSETACPRRTAFHLGSRVDLRPAAALLRWDGGRRGPIADISGARCLVMLGDSITMDHISPAGAIDPDSPAGHYLLAHGVRRQDFNSYGSRRGNHEVMVRGTFANVRLQNLIAENREGPWTVHHPSKETMSIFAAAERYGTTRTPLAP